MRVGASWTSWQWTPGRPRGSWWSKSVGVGPATSGCLRKRSTTANAPTFGPASLDCWSPVSYTHLRAHETVLDLVCRLLLEKKKKKKTKQLHHKKNKSKTNTTSKTTKKN